MNPNLHTFKSRLLGTIILFIGASMQAQNTTYTWVSGGADHISGSIVLDSPSGSVDYYYGDVSLYGFLNYSINDPTGGYSGDAQDFFPFPWGNDSITWNDTMITFISGGAPGEGDLWVTSGEIADLYGPYGPIYVGGSWINLSATAPDGDPSTILVLVIIAFPLLGASSLFKSRSAS